MNFERLYEESSDDYGYRLYKNKSLYDLNNIQIGSILNASFNVNKGESAHRKYFTPYIKGFDYGYEKGLSEASSKVGNSLTPTGHLAKFAEIIGEYDVKKRSMQMERMQLSKYVRDIAPVIALANEYDKMLDDKGFEIVVPEYCYGDRFEVSDNKMLVIINDWHIGYSNGSFNLVVAKQRIDKFLEKIIKKAKMYDVTEFYVGNLGDQIENIYMRKNQSQFCEFGLMEQVDKASELIFYVLTTLLKYGNVQYKSLAGNHDRSCGDVKFNQKGDNANVKINRDVKKWASMLNLDKLTIHDYDEMQDEFFYEINGVNNKFIHGDGKKGKPSQLLKNEMSMDNDNYNLWMGHYHNFNLITENNGRVVVTSGCLSGYNDYSKAFGCSTLAGQTLAIINSDGEFEEITNVTLQ